MKMIVNLGSNKYEYNNNYTCQLNNLHNSLFMSIVETNEKDVSKVDRKLDKRKIHTSSINSSSTLFCCLIHAMCIIFHHAKENILKSYTPGINTSILLKKHYENIFFEKLVNELHP